MLKSDLLKFGIWSALSLALLFALGQVQPTGATEGIAALQPFDQAARAAMPDWVKTWLNVMMVSFLVGIPFAIKQVEARWAVFGFALSILAVSLLGKHLGLQPLIGLLSLCHVLFWSPALYMMLKNRPFLKPSRLYRFWAGWITAVMIFSFIFDIKDAAVYLGYMFGFG